MTKFAVIIVAVMYAVTNVCFGSSKYGGFGFNNYKGDSDFRSKQPLHSNREFDVAKYVELSCHKETPLDPLIVRKAEHCLEDVLDDQTMSNILNTAVLREYKKFSTKVCKIWPQVRTCIDGVIKYLENCHDQNFLGQVADELMTFACSNSYNGVVETTNLAYFLYSGGFSCTDFSVFGKCINQIGSKKLNICSSVERFGKCIQPTFDQCFSEQPWEILSVMFGELTSKMDCDSQQEGNGSREKISILTTAL